MYFGYSCGGKAVGIFYSHDGGGSVAVRQWWNHCDGQGGFESTGADQAADGIVVFLLNDGR